AARVAGGPGIGSGALRPDAHEPAGIDPDDRAAARADRLHVDRTNAGDVTGPAPADPGLGRVADLPARDEADVEGRAAGVADDQIAVRDRLLRARIRERRDGRHRRPGADRVDRPLHHLTRP